MIRLLYIDLFCGAGGTSTGVEAARICGEKCAKVVACVNHDANAIASHAANHPEVLRKRDGTVCFMGFVCGYRIKPGYPHTKPVRKAIGKINRKIEKFLEDLHKMTL